MGIRETGIKSIHLDWDAKIYEYAYKDDRRIGDDDENAWC
jgi:hypothetical protein